MTVGYTTCVGEEKYGEIDTGESLKTRKGVEPTCYQWADRWNIRSPLHLLLGSRFAKELSAFSIGPDILGISIVWGNPSQNTSSYQAKGHVGWKPAQLL